MIHSMKAASEPTVSLHRNLVIQSEPVSDEAVRWLQDAAKYDPSGRRTLAALGVAYASFSLRGGLIFVGYLDLQPIVLGAFVPNLSMGVDHGVAMLGTHRAAASLKRAMTDHLQDAAHLCGYKARIPAPEPLPDRWLGLANLTMDLHVAYP